MEEESKKLSNDEWMDKLEKLMEKNGPKYFNDSSVTMRHDAWFMASAISNFLLIKEIKLLREQISGTTKELEKKRDLL